MKKVYLIYDMADMPKMSIKEAYDAKQKFFAYARTSRKEFTYDLLASENNYLYRVGVILDSFDKEFPSIPQMPIPRNDLDYFGSCIDLAQLKEEDIDRETFKYSTENTGK